MRFSNLISDLPIGIPFARKCWDDESWIALSEESNQVEKYWRKDGKVVHVPWSPSWDDIYAADWSALLAKERSTRTP